eukprot:492989_1
MDPQRLIVSPKGSHNVPGGKFSLAGKYREHSQPECSNHFGEDRTLLLDSTDYLRTNKNMNGGTFPRSEPLSRSYRRNESEGDTLILDEVSEKLLTKSNVFSRNEIRRKRRIMGTEGDALILDPHAPRKGISGGKFTTASYIPHPTDFTSRNDSDITDQHNQPEWKSDLSGFSMVGKPGKELHVSDDRNLILDPYMEIDRLVNGGGISVAERFRKNTPSDEALLLNSHVVTVRVPGGAFMGKNTTQNNTTGEQSLILDLDSSGTKAATNFGGQCGRGETQFNTNDLAYDPSHSLVEKRPTSAVFDISDRFPAKKTSTEGQLELHPSDDFIRRNHPVTVFGSSAEARCMSGADSVIPPRVVGSTASLRSVRQMLGRLRVDC